MSFFDVGDFVLHFCNIYNAHILDNGFKFRIIQYGCFKRLLKAFKLSNSLHVSLHLQVGYYVKLLSNRI